MFYQALTNTDSVNAVKDSISTALNGSEGLTSLSFDFSRIGNNAVIVTVLGYSIVFLALLVLYLTFSYLTKFLHSNIRKKLLSAGKKELSNQELAVSGEISAVISLALYLHFQEIHDFENTVLTIKKVQRPYSPWSSKLYGLRQYPK